MHIRRLVKAGQSSHTVALPKNWLEKNKLSKGNTVYIQEQSPDELLITPHLGEPVQEAKHTTITVDDKTLDTIQREITAAYVNNSASIDLVGKSIAQHAKDIRKILHDFVALEIVEQTANRITAKDMLNLQEISIDKSVKRMDIMIRTMLQDSLSTATGNDLSESVAVRDEDVNRLYFLLVRLLKSALRTPTIANQMEITSTGVLGYWMLVHYLEQLADTTTSVCKNAATEKKQHKQFVSLLSALEQDYRDVMKAAHEKNKALADEVARRRIQRQDTARSLSKPELSYGCSTISTLISDIARLVIDD